MNIKIQIVIESEKGKPVLVQEVAQLKREALRVYNAEAAFDTEEEAHYLAAILNSNVPNDEIKPFQSLGLMGERDIEKKVLELPIPFFDEKKPAHRKLAELSTEAHCQAAAFVAARKLPDSLAKKRGMVREAVSATIEQIDAIVPEVLA